MHAKFSKVCMYYQQNVFTVSKGEVFLDWPLPVFYKEWKNELPWVFHWLKTHGDFNVISGGKLSDFFKATAVPKWTAQKYVIFNSLL